MHLFPVTLSTFHIQVTPRSTQSRSIQSSRQSPQTSPQLSLCQETFIKLVTIKEKKEEQVQMKCWAGWASEDKMRDSLKIKELVSQCDDHV